MHKKCPSCNVTAAAFGRLGPSSECMKALFVTKVMYSVKKNYQFIKMYVQPAAHFLLVE